MSLVLASASPRRRQLLAKLGCPFTVRTVEVDETIGPAEPPAWAARRLALTKAMVMARLSGPGLYLGADTVVVLDGRMLGKPQDADEARAMLSALRGRCHRVITGVALLELPACRGWLTCVQTFVRMRAYRDDEIDRYIASGLPFDRAGAYGIQDEALAPVASIQGCWTNVVGLPLCAVYRLLQAVGLPLRSLDQAEPTCAAHLAVPSGYINEP